MAALWGWRAIFPGQGQKVWVALYANRPHNAGKHDVTADGEEEIQHLLVVPFFRQPLPACIAQLPVFNQLFGGADDTALEIGEIGIVSSYLERAEHIGLQA